ncbi:Alg9-like mannosyltransferase family-domain-containing protein [Crepidotus variabilis]|uniref:Mannosyltransferase n=1 Tax=Crepidotus variabilis TaxID=179855 RepID=A0A9P6JVH5_9AGAR|nr:Alg9-like mannosyltransferase family-domain-containing protein [Crepidotus variabilis]
MLSPLTQDILILLTGYTHVFLCPYTKVEESFNLHAVHDVIMYGVGVEGLYNYDHYTFPSPVPRTFIASLVLAYITKPFIPLLPYLAGFMVFLSNTGMFPSLPTSLSASTSNAVNLSLSGHPISSNGTTDPTKFTLQILIRLVLSTLSSLSLIFIKRRLARSSFSPASPPSLSASSTISKPTTNSPSSSTTLSLTPLNLGEYYTLLSISQFHIPFWMSRTLPNTFALILVNVATGLLLHASLPSSSSSSSAVSTTATTSSISTTATSSLNPTGGTPQTSASATAKRQTPTTPTKHTKHTLLQHIHTSNRNTLLAISLLTLTAIVLRAEVVMVHVPLVLQILVEGSGMIARNRGGRGRGRGRALRRGLGFWSVLRVGVAVGVGALAATILIDTYFNTSSNTQGTFGVGRWIWPELSSILFNVVEGKSSEWGISPWYTYALLLPKLLMASLPLCLIGLYVPLLTSTEASNEDSKVISSATEATSSSPRKTKAPSSPSPKKLEASTQITTKLTSSPSSSSPYKPSSPSLILFLIPYISMIVLLSFLGHKEWRFVMYVVPAFNVGAAVGGVRLSSHFPTRFWRTFIHLTLFGMVFGNMVLTALLTKTSMGNYPGGEAMRRIHEVVSDGSSSYGVETEKPEHARIHIHISNLAAQTGASLFMQLNAGPFYAFDPSASPLERAQMEMEKEKEKARRMVWTYNKTESLSAFELTNGGFTHLISEVPPLAYSDTNTNTNTNTDTANAIANANADSNSLLEEDWRIVDTIQSFERWTVDWDVLRKVVGGLRGLDGVRGGVHVQKGSRYFGKNKNKGKRASVKERLEDAVRGIPEAIEEIKDEVVGFVDGLRTGAGLPKRCVEPRDGNGNGFAPDTEPGCFPLDWDYENGGLKQEREDKDIVGCRCLPDAKDCQCVRDYSPNYTYIERVRALLTTGLPIFRSMMALLWRVVCAMGGVVGVLSKELGGVIGEVGGEMLDKFGLGRLRAVGMLSGVVKMEKRDVLWILERRR